MVKKMKCCGDAKSARAKQPKKGDKYVCDICGFSVIVDQPCDCGEVCMISCCNAPMSLA